MKNPRYFLIIFLISCFHIAKSQIVDSIPPNIIVIISDDARYDEHKPSGGPEWFVTPGIERIANEGVNFTRAYTTVPVCGPSRACIYSGLYTNQNGTKANTDKYDDSLDMIQEVLQDNGYYTGFVGKYGSNKNVPKGFDYYIINNYEKDYTNILYTLNGVDTLILGHLTDVYDDHVQEFLDSAILHQPFALFFFSNVPHNPHTPRNEELGMYADEVIPFPENFYQFPEVYPNYYYEGSYNWIADSISTLSFIQSRFECLKGLDYNIENILDFLDDESITDNTFLLYTSDNGYMIGDHLMRAKAFPLEQNLHMPMYVRYPTWFSAGSVVDDDMVELLDIPKTLLDVASIADTYGYEGYSLHDLIGSDTLRKYVRYQLSRYDVGDFDVPEIRGIRSFDFLYTRSTTDCFVEELYDFNADPQQNQNQILNPAYQDTIAFFKYILDSCMLAINDTATFEYNEGYLVNAYEISDGIDNNCDGLIDNDTLYFNLMIDSDTAFCKGLLATLSMSETLPGYTYQWYKDGVAIISETEPELTVQSQGYYNLIAMRELGFVMLSDTINIIVWQIKKPPVSNISGTDNLCGIPFIKLKTKPRTGSTFQWMKNGENIPGATSLFLKVFDVGDYQVTETNINGCVRTSLPYSITTTCRINNALSELSISPNPTKEFIEINCGNFSPEEDFAIFTIISLGSVAVQSETLPIINNRIDAQIELSKNITSGSYIIQIKTSQNLYQERLVVIR